MYKTKPHVTMSCFIMPVVLTTWQMTVSAAGQQGKPVAEGKLAVGPVWKFKPDPDNVGLREQWFASDIDDTDWHDVRDDRLGWTAQGFPQYNGYGWYRVKVTVPKGFDTRANLLLVFGSVDEAPWSTSTARRSWSTPAGRLW